MELITRKYAEDLGLSRYFTGKECLRGHVVERQVSNGTCCECLAAKKKEYYTKNPGVRKLQNSKYYSENTEKVLELNKKWREQNPEELKSARKKYYESNKIRHMALVVLRKKWVKRATPKWVDFERIVKVYECANEMTKTSGVFHHVDHEIPLKGKLVCGLHVHNNLKPIPAIDNLRKGNRYV